MTGQRRPPQGPPRHSGVINPLRLVVEPVGLQLTQGILEDHHAPVGVRHKDGRHG